MGDMAGAVRCDVDQALGGQLGNRLSDRRDAEADPGRHLRVLQDGARRQLAVDNLGAQLLQHRFLAGDR
jgi:hypothetical protein